MIKFKCDRQIDPIQPSSRLLMKEGKIVTRVVPKKKDTEKADFGREIEKAYCNYRKYSKN